MTVNTFDQLRWLAAQGAKFALPKGRTKGIDESGRPTFEKGWQSKPHTLEEAIEHAKHGGNVGLLCGSHSGGIIAIDRDVSFASTLKLFGEEANTARVVRANAPDRGKLLYRCDGELPKTTSWKPAGAKHPEIELLANGRHALIPPSEYDGGRYLLTNLDAGIRTVSLTTISGLWFMVTGQFLTHEPDNDPLDLKELISLVKDAWTPEKVFRHFGKAGNGTVEERGQVRVLGNGGLLLKDDSWFCHADGIGGDVIGAWHYCETGSKLPKGDRRAFQDTLTAMAESAGIPLRARQKATATADAPKTEPADTATAGTAGGKPTINVNQQLSELVRDALRAVIHANNVDPQHPVLYVRAGTLARVLTDERGRASIVPADAGALLAILAEVAIWITETKRGIADQKVPQSVVTAFLNQADWPGLPVLEGVSMAPVFGHDGSLHAKHGYDPVTQIFNASTLEIERTEPTPEAIQAALSLFFDDMLHDFPFVDAASKAHALALVLLPFCRHMIDGATPLHLISAPAHGAGKSLLAECTLLPAYGREPAATPEARSSDEWSKLLTTVLMDGRPIVFLDNVARPLEGSGMATALTQAFWSDRILGVSRTVNAPIRCVWVASAKNPVASAEIARRCCLIRIDPNTENPEDRTGFKHPHLKRWILENRARLVGAAVTIVQNWVRRGMPIWKGSVKGSYESWTEIVGGILEAAGVPGFLENETAMRESAPETVAMRKFVETWFAVFGEKETTAKDLFPLAASAEDENAIDADSYLGLLAPQLGSGNRKSQQTRLGSLLARSVDAVFSGLKIVRCEKDSRDGGKMYRLAVIDPKRGTSDEKVPRESPEVETVSRNLRNLSSATCEDENFLHNVGDISQYSDRLNRGSAGSANGTATRGSARGTLPEGSAVAAYLGRVLMVTELPAALTAAQADGVKVTQSPVQGGWRIELA